MKLSSFAIRRPLTIFMIVSAMIIFGFISLPRMAVELLPELDLPYAAVVTSVDGGTPAEVEKLVTKPIEDSIGTVPNIKKISSTSVEGSSQVLVQFNWGTNIDKGVQDLRDKVDLVRGVLPDIAKSPRILKFDPNAQPIMNIALTGDNDPNKLKKLAEDNIQSALERVDGVASVGITGGQTREVDVVLDPDKMDAYGLTLDQIKQALASTNVSGSAGSVREGDNKLQIRVQGEYKEVSSIGETPVSLGNGGSILLKNIATVSDTYPPITQKTSYNGKPSVTLSVTKATGGNTIDVADGVKNELKVLQAKLPANAKMTVTFDSSTFIKDSIYTVGEHALIGGLFAVLILFLFLNSFRSMIIVSIVMPISVITTFTLMYFTGQSFNLISLSGLTLGMGSLVDFAVVILENIFRFRQRGFSVLDAAKQGSAQVGNAVMASALAQIAVFLPIVFTQGLASKLFGPLALAVVFSHIAALVVSLMIVPMLGSRWLTTIPDEALYHTGTYKGRNPVIWFNIAFEKIAKGYGRLLHWALNHRKKVLFLTLALFVGSLALIPGIGMEFMPKMDQGQITISIKMPNGTIFAQTEKVATKVEQIAKSIPELKDMDISIGGSGGPAVLATNTTNQAQFNLTLVDKSLRKRSTEQVVEQLRQKISLPGADITVKEVDNSGASSGSPVQVSLSGSDLAVLEDISNVIVSEMKKVPGARNVQSSLDDTVKEVEVNVDPQKASLYGLNPSQVVSFVRTAFSGQSVTKYRTGEDEIDVNLKLPDSYQDDISSLYRLRITTPTGALVPLSSVADISKGNVPQKVTRDNQTRTVQITSDISGRDLGSVMKDVQARLNVLTLPDGYHLDYGGQSQDMQDSFGSLGLAAILSIVLVYMVMVSQFESLFNPFIIMFSIPPTVIGVVIGLFVTGEPLSVSAFIGYILLIGIVVNNAIVLIDYVNHLRKDGVQRDEALLKAGPIRLRPILMTTLATILAIFPLAFGGGSGNESQAPMAVVVIFGLSFSTLVTLILVPVVYTWFDDMGSQMKRRFRRNRSKQQVKQIEQQL
jgi:hydrophobic/amphiphilic exporter-1 (mainly G- bacteria), HAE1 family